MKLFNYYNKWKRCFYELIVLSVPLLIGNLGHTLIGTTDVLVIARYGIKALAAVSIANSVLFTIFIFGIGITASISIILSNKRGKKEKIKHYLYPSILFSLFTSVIFAFICCSAVLFIDKAGFEPSLVPLIKEYIKIVSFSTIGMFVYQSLKEFLQAYEIVKFPNYVLLFSVFINLILDIIFVFGFGCIPQMGVKGAALATLTVRTLMGLVMFIYVFRFINFKVNIDKSYYKNMLKVGCPIGLALTFEFLAFNIVTLLAGREASVLSAVHSILITISSATFMVPLSVSTALSVKTAYFCGAKKFKELKSFSFAGIATGAGFMAFAGVILAIFPVPLIKLFTDNMEVIKITVPLVSIVSMYQVFDGLQVVLSGILKGFKKTKIVSMSVISGYWLIGAPTAFILVEKFHFSLRGYWLALALSLFFMGFIQAVFIKKEFAHFHRIAVDV